MQLLTDYAQYYDGIFNASGPVFHRMAFTRGGLSKPDQFELFERLGLQTPPHGKVTDLAIHLAQQVAFGTHPEQWLQEIDCVVYEDQLAHGGRGKLRLPLAEAITKYGSHFASIYIPPVNRAVNFRHVRVGSIGVWLKQVGGEAEWQSNRRDCETVLRRTQHPGPPPIPRVLWAIDFIPSSHGLLAVDFNSAPELVTLGETGAVRPEEILVELERAAASSPARLDQF